MSKQSHIERTAAEPRNPSLHEVTIASLSLDNNTTRIFHLELAPDAPPINFLPGQFVDVYCPDIEKPGGFTIISPPSAAAGPGTPEKKRYIELAVQDQPQNPAAAYLWRDREALLRTTLHVRVGGSFVYPPPGILPFQLRKIVFVAGGVGINPLISMLAHLSELSAYQLKNLDIRVLYSYRANDPIDMLLVGNLAQLFVGESLRGTCKLFLTGGEKKDEDPDEEFTILVESKIAEEGKVASLPVYRRRFGLEDVVREIDPENYRRQAVVYVCGVPSMTDGFVAALTDPEGPAKMEKHRVLFEKWW